MTDIYIGCDPGGTTGVAWYRPEQSGLPAIGKAYESTDPQTILTWLEDEELDLMELHYDLNFHYTVEAFNGGGYRTTDAIQTLELVGFFYHTFAGSWNAGYDHVRKVGSSQRMSGMREAQRILGPTGTPPHKWDAFSHAVVHSRGG